MHDATYLYAPFFGLLAGGLVASTGIGGVLLMDRVNTLVGQSASPRQPWPPLLTSVGSGSVITLLFLIYPRSPALLVGTDVFHSVLLAAMLSVIHLRMGTVDPRLVALLLLGALSSAFSSTFDWRCQHLRCAALCCFR